MGRKIVTAMLALALLPAATAAAATSEEIHGDCVDGQLDGSYTRGEINEAIRDLPADLDEYSYCRDALNAGGLDASAGGTSSGAGSGTAGGGTSPGGSGSNPNAQPADPQNATEQTAVDEATQRGGSPVRIRPGSRVAPGDTGLLSGDETRAVPQPLIVALILLATVALLGGVLAARARVVTRRLT